MKFQKGKGYWIEDLQGLRLPAVAISEDTLEFKQSYLVGLLDIQYRYITPSTHAYPSEFSITAMEEPATQFIPVDFKVAITERSREAALLELLQAISAGSYARQPYGDKHFDPQKALEYIHSKLTALAREPQQ